MTNVLRSAHIALVFRVVLGTTLLVAGAGKLPRQVELVDLVARLNIAGAMPEMVAQTVASVVPWLEMGVGCLLVLGLLLRFASGVSVALVLGFVAVNVLGMLRGDPGEDCGCFGEVAAISNQGALLIDVALLIMAVQVLFHRGSFLSLDSRIRKVPPRS
ncbi:MAG: MauE/DoxX family redox-associated membrane protein [Chloroflexota bacterium]